jgi:tetraprenyl-beta-curcumene synthase
VSAAVRELFWGLPAVAREAGVWHAYARGIPDRTLRRDALISLAKKRGHTDGAALFATIPRTHAGGLLKVLVRLEIMLDFLDNVSERGAFVGQQNGRQLHLALVDALDVMRPLSDYYLYHPWRDDGGYLRALVEACREGCRNLPSYEKVRLLLAMEATRMDVLAANHDPDPIARDVALREWARREATTRREVAWFELTGASSGTLILHALLTLAASPECTDEAIVRVRRAYHPWIALTTTMLDSYVDQPEDAEAGNHSYVGHYPNQRCMVKRIGRLIRRSLGEALGLPDGERHAVIVACMVALYLSKDSARSEELRGGTASLARAGGSLTRMLLPILRMWRIAYSQRSS